MYSQESIDVSAVYRGHFGFVWASLRSLGVPEPLVEDALQDVFVVVHRRLPDFEGRSHVRTWLFAIARRVAYRHRRGHARAERRRRALAREHDDVDSPTHADPVLGNVLLRALDDLDDDKRTAIVLHVLHELSGPEVADVLGINVDTAYSRIKAARSRLRRSLGRLGSTADGPTLRRELQRATRPPPRARRRIWALLVARLGVTPILPLAPLGAAAVTSGTSNAIVASVLVGAIVLAAGATIGLRTRSRETTPTSSVATPARPRASVDASPTPGTAPDDDVSAPVVVAAPVPPTPTPPPPGDGRHARARAVRPGASPASPVTSPSAAEPDRLIREVALIDAARTALDGGDPRAALERLRRHAREFADGQLVVEREAYQAIAQCEATTPSAGQPAARRFLSRHPHATLATRVREACALGRERFP